MMKLKGLEMRNFNVLAKVSGAAFGAVALLAAGLPGAPAQSAFACVKGTKETI